VEEGFEFGKDHFGLDHSQVRLYDEGDVDHHREHDDDHATREQSRAELTESSVASVVQPLADSGWCGSCWFCFVSGEQ
jgi:hypothetical protein